MVETFFSGFKRLWGERVHARRWERMMRAMDVEGWGLQLNVRVGSNASSFCCGGLTDED